jgi:threonine dehydrogenase-like Zn-dependent dehydrogenase
MATELARRADAVGSDDFGQRRQQNGGRRGTVIQGDPDQRLARALGWFSIDKFPMGSVINRSLTIKSGQCHVHRYMRPLLERVQRGEIDPGFVVTLPAAAG